MKRSGGSRQTKDFADRVGGAPRRAARAARKAARIFRKPVYACKDGKVVAEKP